MNLCPDCIPVCCQVSLFVEQKRSVEQGQLYKELRQQKQSLERKALDFMRNTNLALLRAHQAHLRDIGRKGEATSLEKLPAAQQVTAANAWAHGELDAVRCEAELMAAKDF